MDSSARVDGSALVPVPFESMDFLSRNYAIQVFREMPPASSHELQKPTAPFEENMLKKFGLQQKERMGSVGQVDRNSVPPWKAEDLKSWISLQQMIHPELNLHRCFTKKWKLPRILHGQSIKAWLAEIKRNKKEESRLEKAELHAAISVAGVAAALAAVAAENVRNKSNYEPQRRKLHEEKEDGDQDGGRARDAVMASAAALVATQCVEVARSMGANKDQLGSMIESALAVKDAGDLITLTAAAATSLRGAATLRARAKANTASGKCGGKEMIQLLHHGNAQGINSDEAARQQDIIGFDFLRGRDLLARGSLLTVITEKRNCKLRLVSIILDRETKVLLRTRRTSKLNPFAITKERIIVDLHSWPQEEWVKEEDSPSLIVLETEEGIIKLEMNDDASYKLWSMTINHMLMLSSSYGGY
ncbi:VAN3-binding protein-like isoform X2 [Nymphaea colorata]|uniref:VAN3-binding protein-like isoform X2 n=1 Tax=Nymphaea colorata TaxID=210225 RepID=UPI00129E6BDE|nr:VAN3-binding protein-like isoform X2 [Nymphaea colorata]